MQFSMGVATTETPFFSASSLASLSDTPNDMSTSPRSIRARRVAPDGTSRTITRLTPGSGPLVHFSLRSYTSCWPGSQRVTL